MRRGMIAAAFLVAAIGPALGQEQKPATIGELKQSIEGLVLHVERLHDSVISRFQKLEADIDRVNKENVRLSRIIAGMDVKRQLEEQKRLRRAM